MGGEGGIKIYIYGPTSPRDPHFNRSQRCRPAIPNTFSIENTQNYQKIHKNISKPKKKNKKKYTKFGVSPKFLKKKHPAVS